MGIIAIKNYTISLFFLGSLIGGVPLLAAISTGTSDYLLCKYKKEVRTVRVLDGHPGCRTTYTKRGIGKTVGTARDRSSCFSFMKNIQGNLESANWKCRNVSTATFSKGLVPKKSIQ